MLMGVTLLEKNNTLIQIGYLYFQRIVGCKLTQYLEKTLYGCKCTDSFKFAFKCFFTYPDVI